MQKAAAQYVIEAHGVCNPNFADAGQISQPGMKWISMR